MHFTAGSFERGWVSSGQPVPQAGSVVVVTHQTPYTNTCYVLFADAKPATRAMTKQTTKHLAKGATQLLNLPKKAQENRQPAKPHWQPQEQDPFLLVLEKVLLYSHFFLSLVFFAIISVKWSS